MLDGTGTATIREEVDAVSTDSRCRPLLSPLAFHHAFASPLTPPNALAYQLWFAFVTGKVFMHCVGGVYVHVHNKYYK